MKDLKENIQRNNMKKLVLSVILGMFCYCTNNAMNEGEEEEEKLQQIQNVILDSHIRIHNAKIGICSYEKKIYSAIEEGGKITKKKVLQFIINLYTTDEQKEEGFKDKINTIEQYFHLEEINDDDECNEGNLTEIFWTVPKNEEKEQEAITKEEKEPIKKYFNTIIEEEDYISTYLKAYYDAIKANHKDTGYEEILKIIMADCCGEETKSDPVMNLIKDYIKLWKIKEKEEKEYILQKLQKRITLSNDKQKQKKDFISFLKQKIGEEKKEEEKKDSPKGGKPAEEGGCPCCDCWGKKKNIEVIEV